MKVAKIISVVVVSVAFTHLGLLGLLGLYLGIEIEGPCAVRLSYAALHQVHQLWLIVAAIRWWW
jgi:hypothetical protein